MTIQALLTSGTAAIVHPALCGALVVAAALGGTPAAGQSLSTTPSAELLAMDPLALARLLDESRPAPMPAAIRARVLAGLPKKGEVRDLDDRERGKLAALAPVLEVTQRGSVYAIKIIDVPHAFVGLHARTVVLISRPALRLMSKDELQALMAHENAHEYVYDEYRASQGRRPYCPPAGSRACVRHHRGDEPSRHRGAGGVVARYGHRQTLTIQPLSLR